MADRSALRAQVWEMSGGRCEHPRFQPPPVVVPCGDQAEQLAHIAPRGMGHTGYRDTIDNVMAACLVHAASTDDMTHDAWQVVRYLCVVMAPDIPGSAHSPNTLRRVLASWVRQQRARQGWAV